MVEGGLKQPLVKESSIYQIGGQPGHRSEELMFVFKSIVAKYRSQGKVVIIQSWAKIIFVGKSGNPSFCHINGMEKPIFFVEKRQVLA